jgi:phenylacetate-CoA ligase
MSCEVEMTTERLIRAYAGHVQPLYDLMSPSLRTLAGSARGWFLARNRYSAETFDLLANLRSHESWTPEQISEFQLARVRDTFNTARRTVPFYSNYPDLAWKSLEDLAKLPLLTRETVRQDSDSLVSPNVPRSERIRVTTTGTTGASLRVTYNYATARRNWAFRMRQWAWAGIAPRSPRITLFGSRIVPPHRTHPPFWIHNLAERQILGSIFHLSAKTAPAYIEFLYEHQGRMLEGFPSVLGILADFILETGSTIPMRAVFTDGEPLYSFMRERIERAFCTRVYDSYGNTEFCGLIQECEHHQMHLAADYAFLEILDENNRPSIPGEQGFLVWTGFINDVMPLIRYRIGDKGSWQTTKSCPCGRSFPLVVPTITRVSDLLRCTDGRIFSPRALNQLLKENSTFRFCQFVQVQPGHVVVRAVSSSAGASEEVSKVRRDLQELLGPGMQVGIDLADAPIIRAGGKIPLIVDQMKP